MIQHYNNTNNLLNLEIKSNISVVNLKYLQQEIIISLLINHNLLSSLVNFNSSNSNNNSK